VTNNNRSAISVRGLRTRLGASAKLGPLDLELAVGEHALLVGPSGCGKSSLLRILAGLLPTESGDISLFGQEVSRGSKILLPPRKRGIGFLFQGGALWPHMNVAAHLNFVLRCAAIAPAEWDARRAELLTQVGLEGYPVARLSVLAWLAPWPPAHACSYWTNLSVLWTPSDARACWSCLRTYGDDWISRSCT
jgi:ABC-type Fe3+/spermidine/putrescine transport system ATPase subunit